MKRKTIKLLPMAAKLSTFKPQGVDIGTLQSEYTASSRTLKSARTKLENAQNAVDVAVARHNATGEKLKAGAVRRSEMFRRPRTAFEAPAWRAQDTW